MLSKEVSSTIFKKFFGMTLPGIEPLSPGPLVNTLPTGPVRDIIIIIIIFLFHTSVSWWSFSEVRKKASYLMSSGLFLVFWPILIMLRFGWSSFVPWILTFPVSFPSFWDRFKHPNYNWHHCYPYVKRFFSSLVISKYLSLFLLILIFTEWSTGTAKSTIRQTLFSMSFINSFSLLVGIMWFVYISKSQRILYISFFRADSGLCLCYLAI